MASILDTAGNDAERKWGRAYAKVDRLVRKNAGLVYRGTKVFNRTAPNPELQGLVLALLQEEDLVVGSTRKSLIIRNLFSHYIRDFSNYMRIESVFRGPLGDIA